MTRNFSLHSVQSTEFGKRDEFTCDLAHPARLSRLAVQCSTFNIQQYDSAVGIVSLFFKGLVVVI
jgi:hypothetical protein